MLRILCTAQCDVCGELFDRLGADTTAHQNVCALLASGIIQAAEEEGWFFNENTRQFWCVDCIGAHAGNANLPPVSEFAIPATTFRVERNRFDSDLPF